MKKAKREGSDPWALLDAVPLIWLALVLSAYAVLAMFPLTSRNLAVPGIAEAERAALPVLAALVLGAILRYLRGRGSGPAPGEIPSPEPRSEVKAVQSS
jgi:hypothetical protein